MSTTTKNNEKETTQDAALALWPGWLMVDVPSPLAILRAQIEPLRKITGGVLLATVDSSKRADGVCVCHQLKIIAPALQHYSKTVLEIEHHADRPYPAKITCEAIEAISSMRLAHLSNCPLIGSLTTWLKVPSPAVLQEALKAIFASNWMKSILIPLIEKSLN